MLCIFWPLGAFTVRVGEKVDPLGLVFDGGYFSWKGGGTLPSPKKVINLLCKRESLQRRTLSIERFVRSFSTDRQKFKLYKSIT